MKYSLATVVLGFSALVVAQMPNMPACVMTCVTKEMGNVDCKATDFGCFCKDTAFIKTITACMTKECDANDLQSAYDSAKELCGSNGVTLPSSALNAAQSAASSAHSSATSAASSVKGSASSAASSAAASATATTSSQSAAATGLSAPLGMGIGAAVAAAFLL